MSAGRTDGLIKNFGWGGASPLPPRTLVKFGADDDTVILAASAADAVIGASGELATAVGERVDIHLTDLVEVTYGGAVTRGDLVVSDAQGRAVTAAPAAGANVRTAGTAMRSGVLGDYGVVLLARGSMQG